MAKAPRKTPAPEPSTPAALAAALDVARQSDDYWYAQILLNAVAPLAITLGETRAREVLSRIDRFAPNLARGLGLLGEGLARAGQREAALGAIDEARAVIAQHAVDGELGTLAWCAVAEGLDALGEAAAADDAIDHALACAGRETQNPTQPWPHVALALARMNRVERLTRYLDERIGNKRSDFGFSDAIEIAVERGVARGDLGGLDLLIAARGGPDGFSFVEAFARAALDPQVGAEHLAAALLRFSSNPSYGKDALMRSLRPLAARSGLAVVRSMLASASGAARGVIEGLLASFERPLTADALLADGFADACVQRYQIALLVDPAAAAASLDEAAARSRARAQGSPPDRAAIATLACLGMALAASGEAARGAGLVDEAIKAALALTSHEKSSFFESLGLDGSRYGLTPQAQAALRKLTSKFSRDKVSRALAALLVRQGDFAGAVAVLQKFTSSGHAMSFRLVDGLALAAGLRQPFARFA